MEKTKKSIANCRQETGGVHVRHVGVPETIVLGTLNRHKEKNIDSVLQYICTLRGTVQAIVPESKGPQ